MILFASPTQSSILQILHKANYERETHIGLYMHGNISMVEVSKIHKGLLKHHFSSLKVCCTIFYEVERIE